MAKYDDGSGLIANELNQWGKSKIEACFDVVVEFVKWYNTNRN